MSRTVKNWTLFIITLLIVVFLVWLFLSINTRRNETYQIYTPKVEYDQSETRNEVWGKNFPKQFESYYRTADTTFKSKHNGARKVDMLEEDPRMVVLWAGYGFSKAYYQGRGHFYAIKDMEDIYRTSDYTGPTKKGEGPMPGTCWTCKSPDVPRYMEEHGGGQEGAAALYGGKWSEKGGEIANPIGCGDCHDAKTMELKITRPALIEAFEARGEDISKATHQEMRSLVCAQCHVEYYFNNETPVKGVPYLTFPWTNGYRAEDMEKYYDDIDFKDWTHKLSKAPMLKAQHPGWEVYMTGIHAERGVSCADCHMPYISEGGQKFTDHHMQSPLNNVSASCQVCHREDAEELKRNVYDRQDKILESRNELEKFLVRAHVEAKKAWDLGATEEQMKDILQDIRHAQWRWDYVAASHGGSFHSPVEIGRTLGSGLTIIQEGRIKLARLLMQLGFEGEVPYPDIETKEKAQRFIGLDPEKLEEGKAAFKQTLLKEWEEERKKNGLVYEEK